MPEHVLGRKTQMNLPQTGGCLCRKIRYETSFLVAPATVGSLIRQQTFAGSQGRRHHTDRPGEPPEGKLDRSKGDKGGEGFGEVLEILDKPPVAPEPREGALDHPASRQDDETLYAVAPFDDLQAKPRHFRHRSVNLPCVVAAIGPDQFEPREPSAYLV